MQLYLLGVVRSLEEIKNYLHGQHFFVMFDRRVQLLILKEHCSNKSQTPAKHWFDRLLTYKFSTEHMPVAKMGLVVHISRHPGGKTKVMSVYFEEFLVAKLELLSDWNWSCFMSWSFSAKLRDLKSIQSAL